MAEKKDTKETPEENERAIQKSKPVYEPPKLKKFDKLQKLIVSGE